jgi:hypothetical protein
MIAQEFIAHSSEERIAQVVLQNQLVPLLSEQLYRSPIKAVEELVVNSYDAVANQCNLFVPSPAELNETEGRPFIVVFDDGHGMDVDQLISLWDVGRSPKLATRKSAERKQIGKFGIGKLATYAVANRLTYLTKTDAGIFTSSLDYHELEKSTLDASGHPTPVPVPIRKLIDWDSVLANEQFVQALDAAAVDKSDLDESSWTLAILEDLKDKAKTIKQARLNWVLKTAMPLRTDFRLFLNGEEIKSAKEDFEPLVEFSIADLSVDRISGLNQETGENWKKDKSSLVSKSFPSGVNGSVLMTRRSLAGGKSDDLERSHGFFVRVLGRLINLEDPLFGMRELSYKYFYRMRADINADDLDDIVVAAREGVELSDARRHLVELLREIFNEARAKYDEALAKEEGKDRGKKEDDRAYVSPRYVEHPLADILTIPAQFNEGAEADRSWFYLELPEGTDIKALANRLYNEKRAGYNFAYVGSGRRDRIVKFNPQTSTFTLNSNHEFVQKHRDNGAQYCLEDIVIAETLLEVYLREEGVSAAQTGEILQRRDELLRNLANDDLQSPARIAQFLEDSSENEHDLEIGLVVAARAIGFTANHISGSDEPDGVAAWIDHPGGVRRIILEAKSSKDVPSLGAIDFGVLQSHVKQVEGATGCLLLAPDYPGVATKDDYARAAKIAVECRISCWTIRDLASLVRESQSRHINAQQIIQIVENIFTPKQVEAAVKKLLEEPKWDRPTLIRAILDALSQMEDKLPDAPRSIDQISTIVSLNAESFEGIQKSDVKSAVSELAAASQGTLHISGDGDTVRLLTAVNEIERRASSLLKSQPAMRKPGTFRKPH